MTEDNVDINVFRWMDTSIDHQRLVEFQKLASMGLTIIIIADGDVGANDLGAPPYESS
jgi:hypothetical protein